MNGFTDDELKGILKILCAIANRLCRSGNIESSEAMKLLEMNADVVTSICVKNMDLWYWYQGLLDETFKDVRDQMEI